MNEVEEFGWAFLATIAAILALSGIALYAAVVLDAVFYVLSVMAGVAVVIGVIAGVYALVAPVVRFVRWLVKKT